MKCQFVCIVSFFLWISVCEAQTCNTPLGESSNCVTLYECPPLRAAFDQRPLKGDVVSFLRQSQCGFEGYVPKVCCGPLPAQTTAQPTQRPRPTRPPVFDNQVTSAADEDGLPAPSTECGLDTNQDRIYGGLVTDLDEFPWMALLGYRTKNGTLTYQCGGVLINHRYVLTAAHCVTGAIEREVGTLASVRLGEYNIQSDMDCIDGDCADPPQEIPVQVGIPHSGFSDKNKNRQDDIGLVRLAQRAKYSHFVKPICLPDNRARLAIGDDVFVAGWGKTLNGRNSPIKLKLRLPVFDKQDCYQKYSTLGAELTNKQICAGGVFAEDACRGDSGGPLMRTKSKGIWESIAVVSFGYGCGRDGWPGVYTSVVNYLDWIKDTMRSSNV